MLKLGDKVRVTEGFFEGVEGRVMNISDKPVLAYISYQVEGVKLIGNAVIPINEYISEGKLQKIEG